MTFLLQKFNAINRTRAEARARNGLRSSVSGIAFTGRFAVCLLLAGFLGVGSAMAQSKILRVGDGHVTIEHSTELQVHHYQIGTADAVNNPTGIGGTVTNTFLIGGMALVTAYADDDLNDSLHVAPISPGAFKIVLSPSADADLTDADDTPNDNPGTPVLFEVMSSDAPRLAGITTNADVQSDMIDIGLIPRDDKSKTYESVSSWFSDPNDIFLQYSAKADTVGRGKADGSDGEKIVTAVISGDELTITLTEKAMMGDVTDVWVFAHDKDGEYARKRIQVEVGTATNPYVDTELAEEFLREDSDQTTYSLSNGFMDPDVASATRDASTGDATTLSYKVTSNADAQKVSTSDSTFTLVATYMLAEVTEGSSASVSIFPRKAGIVTFTVEATDKGVFCRDAGTDETVNIVADDVDASVSHDTDGARCQRIDTSVTPNDTTYTDPFPDSKSVTDTFVLTIITASTPTVDNAIPPQEVDSPQEVGSGSDAAIMIDLEDLNGDKDGAPAAFQALDGDSLTYSAVIKAEDDEEEDIVTVSVEGSVITITPMWRKGDKSTTVTVTAENNRPEKETASQDFTVTVKSATVPIVNPKLQPLLAAGITLNTGDGASVWDLEDLRNPLDPEESLGALFIDPNASSNDQLPGGLSLEMRLDSVEADHRYDNLSTDNDVYTSAMRITLDPSEATLTIIPIAPNWAKVMISATDRELNVKSVTVMVTVVSGVGIEGEELPKEVELSQNYPNPFNPQTTIDYALPQASDVSLIVYDMLGREVDVLLDGPQVAGRHTVRFGANHLPNGAYVYRLVAGDKTITRTMVLVK